MTPLERMAKANYEAESGFGSWDLVSELSQKKLCQYMRAALLALAEAELSRKTKRAGVHVYIRASALVAAGDYDEPEAFAKGFADVCRSIANGGGGDDSN